VVSEVVDEEHVPEHSAVVAGAAQLVEVAPDGPAAEEGRDLPEDEDGDHVGGPDADEAVQDGPEVELPEALHPLELLEHAEGDEEAADPEEGVDCEVGGRHEGGHSWCGEDVCRLGPVLDVHEPEPGVVAEDDPEDGEHPRPVEEEQVLVLGAFGDADDLREIVVDAEGLHHAHGHALALRELAD